MPWLENIVKKYLAGIFIIPGVTLLFGPTGFAADVMAPTRPIAPKVKSQFEADTRKPDRKAASYAVRGKVTDQKGAARAGLTVKAADRIPGEVDKPLGQTMTDRSGNYAIAYRFAPIGKKTAPDLVITVYEGAALLTTSDVIFNARPLETRDFVIPTGNRPDFKHPETDVKPLPKSSRQR